MISILLEYKSKSYGALQRLLFSESKKEFSKTLSSFIFNNQKISYVGSKAYCYLGHAWIAANVYAYVHGGSMITILIE